MIKRKTVLTAPQQRVLGVLSCNQWMTTADIAEALDKSLLTPKEVKALKQLAEQDTIDMEIEIRGKKVYGMKFIAKKEFSHAHTG